MIRVRVPNTSVLSAMVFSTIMTVASLSSLPAVVATLGLRIAHRKAWFAFGVERWSEGESIGSVLARLHF